jgi:hypothetical protein
MKIGGLADLFNEAKLKRSIERQFTDGEEINPSCTRLSLSLVGSSVVFDETRRDDPSFGAS